MDPNTSNPVMPQGQMPTASPTVGDMPAQTPAYQDPSVIPTVPVTDTPAPATPAVSIGETPAPVTPGTIPTEVPAVPADQSVPGGTMPTSVPPTV